jgi:hypothetical protein
VNAPFGIVLEKDIEVLFCVSQSCERTSRSLIGADKSYTLRMELSYENHYFTNPFLAVVRFAHKFEKCKPDHERHAICGSTIAIESNGVDYG